MPLPSAAQVHLALKMLTLHKQGALPDSLMAAARPEILVGQALKFPDWTGATESCGSFGEAEERSATEIESLSDTIAKMNAVIELLQGFVQPIALDEKHPLHAQAGAVLTASLKILRPEIPSSADLPDDPISSDPDGR